MSCSSRWPTEGMAILLISSEIEEIVGLAHRVLVMRAGRLVADLGGARRSTRRPSCGGVRSEVA